MFCVSCHNSSDMNGLEISQNAVVCNWPISSTVFAYCIYHIFHIYNIQQLVVSWPELKWLYVLVAVWKQTLVMAGNSAH